MTECLLTLFLWMVKFIPMHRRLRTQDLQAWGRNLEQVVRTMRWDGFLHPHGEGHEVLCLAKLLQQVIAYFASLSPSTVEEVAFLQPSEYV